MISNDTLLKVKNRDNGSVGYTIPDLNNLHRRFAPGEVKDITMGELRKLSWLTGGKYLLKNCLLIENQEALKELIGTYEPEYFYTEQDIENLLKNGSLDELLDCLDFAPTGVIDLLKTIAVKIELNDVKKRQAIYEKTGFNITSAIEVDKETREERKEEQKKRRLEVSEKNKESTENKEEGAVRRTTPKYKIIE